MLTILFSKRLNHPLFPLALYESTAEPSQAWNFIDCFARKLVAVLERGTK